MTASSGTGVAAFLAARDFLLQHREDYATAYRDFRWPQLSEFNWALDYFDALARGNDAPALWIVDENGAEDKVSFARMSRALEPGRQLAALAGRGARRPRAAADAQRGGAVGGDARLHEARRRDRAHHHAGEHRRPRRPLRPRRRQARDLHRLGHGQVRRLSRRLHAHRGRRAGGAAPAGWQDYADARTRQPAAFAPDGPTQAGDPLFLYFTSGTTSKPKLVLHSHQSYPVGHLSTMYWIGLKPGDVHWNISSPGWAKHAWSCFFAPWNAGATIFIYNYARFNAPAALDVLVKNKVTSLCAPPTVWRMLMQQDLGRYKTSLRELVGAGEPLNPEVIDIVQTRLGHHDPRRLRPDRDDRADRQPAGPEAQARLDGPAAARLRRWRCWTSTASPRRRARSRLTLSPRPLGADAGLPGRRREDLGGDARRPLPHGRRRRRATPTATSPTSAAPTTCSRPPTTASARSSWRAC